VSGIDNAAGGVLEHPQPGPDVLAVHFFSREGVGNAANIFRLFPCPRTRPTASGRASSRLHRGEPESGGAEAGAGTHDAPAARAKALFGVGGRAGAGRRLASPSLPRRQPARGIAPAPIFFRTPAPGSEKRKRSVRPPERRVRGRLPRA
jgi:hypothetical protein